MGFLFADMDEYYKTAYRQLLCQFLIEIKTAPFTPVADADAIILGKYAGPVAYLLHHLASSSASDFEDFDEKLFWKMLTQFEKQTGIAVSHYRKLFDTLI